MTSQSPLKAYRITEGVSLEALATRLSVNKSTVHYWERKRIPAERVLEVERATSLSRHDLRPDLFPREGVA